MRRPLGLSQLTGDAEPGWAGAAARAAMVAVLLAVAVIGLRARGALSHQSSSVLAYTGGRVIVSVFAAAEGVGLVALAVVLALLLRRPRRHKPEDEAHDRWRTPRPWWAKPLAVLLAMAMLVAPWVILLAGRNRRNSTPPAPLAPIRLPVPRPGTGHPVAPSGGSHAWPLLVGVLLAVAAVFILAILARRRRQNDRGRTPRRAPDAAPLAEGLAAGQDALLAGGAPRAAIIACYAALERGFAAAGSAPAVADTPAEVLTRANGAGLVRSGSAEVLTALFRRARYSSQPMTSADSEAAASALARMRADLDGTGPGSGR